MNYQERHDLYIKLKNSIESEERNLNNDLKYYTNQENNLNDNIRIKRNELNSLNTQLTGVERELQILEEKYNSEKKK